MRKKRLLAVTLAASMVMGNVVMASAATTDTYKEVSFNATGAPIAPQQGQVTGTGYVTDLVQDKIFKVVVPAQRVTGEADLFDFIMDPQGLIDATSGAKYISGADIAGGSNKEVSINNYTKISKDTGLYFVNSSNGTKTLSNTSDELVIINKSTMDVDISVNAKVEASSGGRLTVSTDSEFTDYKEPSVYIGIIPNGKTEKPLSAGDARVDTATIGNAKEFYTTSYNGTNIVYDIPSQNAKGEAESTNAYKTYKFKLTGAVNKEADWMNPSQVSNTATVTITYDLTEHVDKAPDIATKSYTLTQDRGLAVDVSLGDGDKAATGIQGITFNNGTADVDFPAANYSFNATTKQLIFTRDFVNTMLGASAFTSRDYKVTFNDAAKTTVTITLSR